MSENQKQGEWMSLVPISTDGDAQPLYYVVPYLVDMSELHGLGEELSGERPLYGLRPRGLDGDVEPHHSIEEMASDYLEEIKSANPEGPYLVGGHCSGARVAFEMAQQLEADGEDVTGVIVVDLGPPGVDRPEVVPWRYIVHRFKHFRKDGRLFHAVRWQVKVAALHAFGRRVGTESSRNLAAVETAHAEAHGAYVGGSVDCDVALIRSTETLDLGRDWFLRWDEKTSGEFHVIEPVEGIHSALLNQPRVQDLASAIRTAIALLKGDDDRTRQEQR